ncbi:MAG: (deoxy)nucleoside triphosphate pyrophosphohydrolase [Oscillospiraceae bacterium]|nr:(deoxy)nucleoside triphosphate pyrophosphohydrolase [Oscillospiraceae bacterium]
MKKIRVVAAIIHSFKEGKEVVFATQRGYGDFKDGWEFPGGKVEEKETPEDAIVREIKEELTVDIVVEKYLTTVEYDYPQFHLSMDCYICRVQEGNMVLKEHEAARWLCYQDLDSINWLPADIKVVTALKDSKEFWNGREG